MKKVKKVKKSVRMKKCECGQTDTICPLTKCRPCGKCGQILHNQYHILYHPNCTL